MSICQSFCPRNFSLWRVITNKMYQPKICPTIVTSFTLMLAFFETCLNSIAVVINNNSLVILVLGMFPDSLAIKVIWMQRSTGNGANGADWQLCRNDKLFLIFISWDKDKNEMTFTPTQSLHRHFISFKITSISIKNCHLSQFNYVNFNSYKSVIMFNMILCQVSIKLSMLFNIGQWQYNFWIETC